MTCRNLHCSFTPPNGCPDKFGCPVGVCPDFVIRRHDSKPSFRVNIEDCDGPLDLANLILEASMWARGRLKKTMLLNDNFFSLADNIGFEQVMIGDIILVDRPRLPEKMLVIGFDEADNLVEVQRGYHGTTPQKWKKGTRVRIVKFMGATAQTEMLFQDIIKVDGTTAKKQLTNSFFVYEWGPNDTCLPGCYYLEFKLLKMVGVPPISLPTPPNVVDNDDEFKMIGDPEPYSVNGPFPKGSVFGPKGPYVLPGSDADVAVHGMHGTDNLPVAPLPMSEQEERDDEVLEHLYKPDPGPQKVVPDISNPSPYGNSPTAPLYPQPLNPNEGANPSFLGGSIAALSCDNNTPSIIPSFTSLNLTPMNFGCGLGTGVEWVRRFPVDTEGFLIHVTDSPSAEF